MNDEAKHIVFIIVSIGLSVLVFAMTVWLGVWKYALAFNIGWTVGIANEIAYPWEWIDVIMAGWFWMIISYVREGIDDCWWFRFRYRIDVNKIRKYIYSWLNEKVDKFFTYPRVWIGEKCNLVIGIDDIDEIVKIEDEIISEISERFGIPKERISIHWDDEWRYW